MRLDLAWLRPYRCRVTPLRPRWPREEGGREKRKGVRFKNRKYTNLWERIAPYVASSAQVNVSSSSKKWRHSWGRLINRDINYYSHFLTVVLRRKGTPDFFIIFVLLVYLFRFVFSLLVR
ncbi:hypothetical protein E2C01_057835 [Portunus trituberculatus]|uniref:Transmembrane protein n=1 Tax=Portunus trituberculatus TaxID=210409 RepID=A0A5B7H129_PORTR|nr:hypothetical protein [Portunus trituberculatus]